MFRKLRERKAFTLVEIMIVVAIVGLLVAIAIPNFVKARNNARLRICDNNLRVVGHGEEQYMMDNNTSTPAAVATLVTDEYLKAAPACPASGSYTLDATNGTYACDATDHGTYTISTGAITH